MHNGFVVRVTKTRPHPNADKMKIATFFGNDVCIGIDTPEGELGIYFPSDLQLSMEYCEQNNLLRKKDEQGRNIGGYMNPAKRNVTAIKLRGERSDGIYAPIESLAYTGVDLSSFHAGDIITTVNGHEICRKYIPAVTTKAPSTKNGNRTRKKKVPIAPLFAEHADTEQLAYNLQAFQPGDQIEVTLKLHGTSQRTGYLPRLVDYKKTIMDRLFHREGTPQYDWGYVTGTRRVVIDDFDKEGFYDNAFREQHANKFVGKLQKGETVYYEVVGYQPSGTPIMGTCDNRKTNDKEFIKQYGKTTTFSYGCEPGESELYVYRMTLTNEDGYVVEYSPDYMRYRCEQIGVNTVPVFGKTYIPSFTQEEIAEAVQELANEYNDGPDPIGETHVREGVVVRIVNRPKFTAFKSKNFSFKCIEGIAKASADAPDIEEAQEVADESI